MENRGPVPQTENERRCQIEGCNDVTVGARTSLCRKHRNNKYKQNYKKKKRKAQGTEENQGESLESQLAVEKYHLEQKYASMLQQVLVQKRLELLQSPSICNLLRIHQKNVRENKQKELLEKRKAAQDERNSKMQQEKHSKSLSTNSSTSCSSTTCNSGTTTKLTSGPSKTGSSSKTPVKSSKQSSRPPQGRNSSKHSKNRNNSNSSVESTINGLVPHCKITSSGNESVGHTMYASPGVWNLTEEKSEFGNLRQVQNFPQQQQIAPQQMLLSPTQQALHQHKQDQQQNPSQNMQVQLLQHFQQHNIPKEQLQYLQHQNLLEQAHQKQLLHEKKQQQQQQQQLQQQQQQQQQQQRLQEQQLVQQQQQLSQQRRLQQQQQQRQQELHIQLQNSRQQQLQQQQQQQQRQQLQSSSHQNQQQVQFHQQQQQQQQHQACTSSVASSVKNISSTELLLRSLPSIQSSMSSLLVSQSHINTSSHDCISSSGILTTRHSVLPRTVLTNTQGKIQNGIPMNHMVSNAPSVTSHRPIAPRLEGHPSINNTFCNGGMPIITAIISAPLTQQIMPQCTPNVDRNSVHVSAEASTLNPMNSSGNAMNNHYPLMPFNVQMDMNLLQGIGAQFSDQNVQCAPTQVRGRQMLLD